jgi:hypothetical protein
MSTDMMNISAFKGMAPAAAFAALDPHSESLADGIGSSYGIIGYKGKVWTLRLRGETYTFTRPDDGSPAAFLDVIVLRQLPNKSKSYYPPGTYSDGAIGTRPVCAALDGVTPDADIATPQSTACAICPKNVFKVNPDGRKTRDCSDYKRLAVLVLPSLTARLLGAPLMEPVFLRVPAASLNDLALLGEGMAAQGFHFASFITRIGFNPEKPHPQMTFRALQALTDKEAPLVLPMRDDPLSLRITGETEIGAHRPAAAATAATPAGNVVDAAAVEAARVAKAASDAAAKLAAEAAAKAAAAEAAAKAEAARKAAEEAAAAAHVDTGFGALTGTVSAGPVASAGAAIDTGFGVEQPVQTVAAAELNTVADTGEPEETDALLDARVAALLPKA